MKKVLIVNKSFETGGIQSSMVNMANELVKYCDVNLFLYNPEGPMKERLNSSITVLPVSWRFRAIGMTLKQAVCSKDVRIIAFRIFISIWTKLFTNQFPIDHAIKHQGKLLGYDMAIAFHQEQRKKSVVSGFARAVDQLTDAKVKIAWIHYDSAALDLDHAYNEVFYHRMDKIFCVSRSLMESFKKTYPALAEKMDYCYNFMDYEKILAQSELPQEQKYPDNQFICFSACRLVKEKALVRAIKSLAPVFREYADVLWYIAGSGAERSAIEQAIEEEALADRIILLGNQTNPYPYMRNANLVMNVSYHEAAPMVFFEARALGRPVFATKTSSAMELLNDGVDAFICENTEEGILARFSELISDRGKITCAEMNLHNLSITNQDSLEKILSLL